MRAILFAFFLGFLAPPLAGGAREAQAQSIECRGQYGGGLWYGCRPRHRPHYAPRHYGGDGHYRRNTNRYWGPGGWQHRPRHGHYRDYRSGYHHGYRQRVYRGPRQVYRGSQHVYRGTWYVYRGTIMVPRGQSPY